MVIKTFQKVNKRRLSYMHMGVLNKKIDEEKEEEVGK